MNTLVIDRSTSNTSIALLGPNGETKEFGLGIWKEEAATPPSGKLEGIDRIVVGTGPGSFAGIRSALAFAQGCAIGSKCEVLGLTSAAALATDGEKIAVVGDSRRGKCWIALFDGYRLEKEVFQVEFAEAGDFIPEEFRLTTPDAARIGEKLREKFGERFFESPPVTAGNLAKAFTANAALLKPEPLPIYLNPAVRD